VKNAIVQSVLTFGCIHLPAYGKKLLAALSDRSPSQRAMFFFLLKKRKNTLRAIRPDGFVFESLQA